MIDLSKCIKGDVLICKTGAILEYISPTDKKEPEGFYDHKIKYLFVPGYNSKFGDGTRTNDGFVFKKNRQEGDHDVVAVFSKKDLKKLIK